MIDEGAWQQTRMSLIARLKNWDDQQSWQEFYDTYAKLIFGVALKSGLSHAEAEEVVQETVLNVCKKIKDFKAVAAAGSFKAWLRTQARWRILDQIKKRASLPGQAGLSSATGLEDTRTTPVEQRVPDPAASALDQLWDQEWQENLLKAALEKMKQRVSAKQFQIFYLHVIKKWPTRAVAKALDVPVGQVYLARHRLSPLLSKAVKELEIELV